MQAGGQGGLLSRMDSSVTPRPARAEECAAGPIFSRHLWWLLLAVGAAVWVVAEVITGFTRDNVLVPTVILLGSFLVPVCMVVLAVSRRREPPGMPFAAGRCGSRKGLVGDGWQASWPNEEDWIGSPTSKELWVQTLAYNGLLLLNALIGTFWLIRMWRSGAPAEAEAATA
jgi:hypothetical protein